MFEKKIVAVQDRSGKTVSVRLHLYSQRDATVYALSPDVPDLRLTGSTQDMDHLVERFRAQATGFEWAGEDW